MTRLGASISRALDLLRQDLSADGPVEALLTESAHRRGLDLSDLDPAEQAELVAGRSTGVLPSVEGLRERIEAAGSRGRPLVVKLGIDPTSADVHLGHAVPMLVLSRFQRMGHQVVLIIGDVTAKIGDPSGRAGDRPPLTDADIARNLATYRDQVSPFFDFTRADFRHNSTWLAEVRLPELIEILAQVPVSMSMQREDFRTRLEQGQGLSTAEFVYSVVMAIDSVEIDADIELGGVDQLLNMQMGRKVMEITGRTPQLVVTMPLIEGTDGTGRKMSKSAGNYVALNTTPEDVFGKVMSIPDRLVTPYLRAWTEWSDQEVDAATARVQDGTLHPMDLKRILAGETVAALHGVPSAMAARAGFTARFSRRTFSSLSTLPVVGAQAGEETVGAVLARTLEFTPSLSAARRVAKQNGLRLVIETGDRQDTVPLTEDDVQRTLNEVVAEALGSGDRGSQEPGPQESGPQEPGSGASSEKGVQVFLKTGRKVARIESV